MGLEMVPLSTISTKGLLVFHSKSTMAPHSTVVMDPRLTFTTAPP